MSPLQRLPTSHRVNAHKPITFTFDGKTYTGCEGDTLASALLANGVKRVGRSFKFHRPRGLMSAGVEEPNALVQLEDGAFDEANARATLIPLYEGLKAKGQNAWPNVDRDLFSVLGAFQRMLPASFYYKSMIWPNWSWYEGIVRKMAGLGRAPQQSDAQQYHKRNLHCDLLICGAGPAGLAAALAGGHKGLRVVLIDNGESLGGSLLGDNRNIDGKSASQWVTDTVEQLKALPEVRLLPRTTVSGYYDHNFLAAIERVSNHLGPKAPLSTPRERLWRIRAKQVVLATGAIERPLVFANNDRPGVMLASAVRTYANQYGVAAGSKVVVVTNNDSAYHTAIDLYDAGVKEISIVDTRANIDGHFQKTIAKRNIRLYSGYSVKSVHGRRSVKGVTLAKHLGDGQLGDTGPKIRCDLIAVSGGWTPAIHLYSQAGGSLDFDKANACFVPRECAQSVKVIGAANGQFSLQQCLAEGTQAISPDMVPPSTTEYEEQPLETYWFTKGAPPEKQWLDFQYDVKVSDIELAQRENFVSIEHVKRYTTTGMSVDQGKTSNVNTLAVMAELTGREIPQVGTTKFRPPYHPVTIGTFAGRSVGEQYSPRMELPAHRWHVAHNAFMDDYGFTRPEYYPLPGEDMETTVTREVALVRNGVGMFDGSPLGKIEVKGPDAAKFLNRMYVNNVASLKVGFARYGFMTNENGVLIDDGVFVRLADDHFLLHSTSAAASRISLWLEEWLQCEWQDLQVLINNVTTQWANLTLSGPKARAVISKLDSDIDFDAADFPHMQYREGIIEGVPARVLRASFTGEVTFEISVPARYALALWERAEAVGAEFGIAPYGIEALQVMRIEKGYLHIGVDTDGNTNPLDIGWGRAIDKKQDDFVGRRSLLRTKDQRKDRLQYVGIEPVEHSQPLPVGGHIVSTNKPVFPEASQGYVTSARHSPTLGHSVGVGIVAGASDRIGEEVYIYAKGATVAAKLVSPTHFDARGERLNG